MKFTVITVVLNDETNIGRTIESVLNQTYTDYEYIVCDGKSTDTTLEIVMRYKAEFEAKNIAYRVYSQKDNGIYDAMNKALDKANGEYVCFINSGDWFYSNDVFEKVSSVIVPEKNPEVVYGNMAMVDRGIVSYMKANDANLLKRMSIFHPSTFTSVPLMKEKKFNTSYRIASDYDLFLTLKLEERNFQYIDETLTYFSYGGLSTTLNVSRRVEDRMKIYSSHNIKVKKSDLIKAAIKGNILNKIKICIPDRIWIWWSVKVKHKTKLDK